MVGAIPLAIGAIGGLVSAIGGRSQQQAQNRLLQQAAAGMSPEQINATMAALSPNFFSAFRGYDTTSPLGMMFSNPGYVNPALWAAPVMMREQMANNDMSKASAIMGKSNMGLAGGGPGAWAFASMGSKSSDLMNLAQQRAQILEQLKRQDISQGQTMAQGWFSLAGNINAQKGAILSRQQAPMNGVQMLGNAGLGFANAMASMPKPTSPKPTSDPNNYPGGSSYPGESMQEPWVPPPTSQGPAPFGGYGGYTGPFSYSYTPSANSITPR